MNSRIIILCFFFLHSFLALTSTIDNRSYYFLKIDDRIGLSESNVKCIIQDHLGFIWFGTKNGLDRYDGNSIREFECNDNFRNVGNNNISALYENHNHCIWVGTDQGVYIFDPVTEVFSFFDKKTSNGIQITQWISDIKSDFQGNIWIVSPNQGAFQYNTRNHRLKLFYTNKKGQLSKNNIECICVRKNKEVWFGTNGAGLFFYDYRQDRLKQFISDRNHKSLSGKNIFTICDYDDGLAVGIHEEKLLKYDIRNNLISEVNASDVHYKIIRSLMFSDGELWVGTNNGLYIINEKKNKVVNIRENFIHSYGLSDNVIFCIYQDIDKDIWLGTLFGGVNYLPNYDLVFDKYVPMNTPSSLSSRRIRDMVEVPGGDIWIGTEEGDVNIFTPSTKQFSKLNISGKKEGRMAMMLNGDKVWIGNFKNGLDVVSVATRRCTHYTPAQLGLLDEGSVFSLCRDHKGNIWLGNGDGLYISDGTSMKFKRVMELAHLYIYDIISDSRGNMWVATMGSGVYKKDAVTGKWKHFIVHPGNPNSLSSLSISSMTEDHNGNIWFATDRGGICMYNVKSCRFITFSKKDGLPDDVSYKILEDKNHNIWFGTNRGLVRFDPLSRNIRVFKRDNGLLGNQFNYKSALKSKNGTFYFGGIDGLISFTPNSPMRNDITRRTYITRICINNKEIVPTDNSKILKNSILYTHKIYLNHDQNNISLDFAALCFSSSASTKYAYKMEGIDKDWIYTSKSNASYSQLPPGNYNFLVKEVNNNPDNKLTSLSIRIYPPWWLSTYAYIFYILLISWILAKIYSWYRERQKNIIQQKQRLFEIQKERELSNAKVEFFTDIAHEIRTPLTLINGSLENIKHGNSDEKKTEKNLRAIEQNSNRLLELVNQLLDFRKVDENKLQLNFTIIDIVSLLNDIVERFEPSLSRLNKEISVIVPYDKIEIPVDKEAVIKILSNLLNNAQKYSEKFVRIEVSKEPENLKVQITNDGDKIPVESANEIFKPFVQLNKSHSIPGSGIGLALARSLAELHSGKLYLETESLYNSFVLLLPYEQQNVIKLNSDTGIEKEDKDEVPVKDRSEAIYSVLIVEDNEDVCNLIAERLSENYRIETASNGMDGLRILSDKHIDVIISDIMMPVMDGLTMTRKIRENIEYSYMPIILLTAQQDMHNHIKGLEVGADAYIEKPFSFHYLITQIDTLISNRRHELESYKKKPYISLQNSNVNKDDELFLEKATNYIIENIEDPDFNVEELAEKMCLSRSSLHRHIKATSNMSPIDFIRFIRLKKAAELICENKYLTTELCSLVGINSPSYFIKLFQKQYGVTPKEFAKQQTIKKDGSVKL